MSRQLLCLLAGFVWLPCFAQPDNSRREPSATVPTSSSQSSEHASGNAIAASSTTSTTASLSSIPNPLGEALSLYRKGDFDGAIAKYRNVLQQRPKSPDALAGIVRVYLKQKKVDEAARAADEALSIADAPRTHVAHAEVLFRQGRIEDAEKEWVSVINGGHPEARAYLGLASVRRAIAMYKSARAFIKKAHDLDPGDSDIQEAWISTLPRSERIKYLEEMLAGENNWDTNERLGTANYLEYLKERSKRKERPCRLVGRVTSTETPLVRLLLDPQHLRGYGLTVVLNGHKSNLMLDTGAGGIVVKRAIAEKAGIAKISSSKIGGVGDKGWKNAHVGIVDSIKIGGLEFQNCPIKVMDSRSVADEDGLVGADVFEDFLVDIDFPDEKLKLSELPKRPGELEQKLALRDEEDDSVETGDTPHESVSTDANNPPSPSPGPQDRYIAPEMQTWTHVFRFGHDLLVPTKIGNVPHKLFVLDTGALSNCISPAAAREVTKVGVDPDMQVKGVSGMVNKVYSANKAIFEFGHLRQENQEIVAFDTTSLSDNEGTEISGFLGFTMLRLLDIKIDYRDALVDFSFDKSRWHF